MAMESGGWVEQILAVLQVENRVFRCRIVHWRQVDHNVARRRKIAGREAGMQTKAALVLGAAVRQHSVYAKIAVRMRRDYIKWYSPSLHRDMELLAFGNADFPS